MDEDEEPDGGPEAGPTRAASDRPKGGSSTAAPGDSGSMGLLGATGASVPGSKGTKGSPRSMGPRSNARDRGPHLD